MFKTALLLAGKAVTDRKGVTAAEYAVLAAGIVVLVAGAAQYLGPKIDTVLRGLL